MDNKTKTKFTIFFWFVDWKCISLGLHLNLKPLHIEIHIPFGFVKIGWDTYSDEKPWNWSDVEWREFKLI